jgi:hypothetical protein
MRAGFDREDVEEVVEVWGLVALDEQLRQPGDRVQGKVPDAGVADHLVPRVQSRDDHIDNHDAGNVLVAT